MTPSGAANPPAVDVTAGGRDPVLVVDDVVQRFGGVTAVDHVSFSLNAAERLAVIGPNGAGKTTLFRLIAGEMRPASGRIGAFGRDVTRMPAHRRARLGLSRTFQVSTLFAGVTVGENVRLAAQAKTGERWRFWRSIQPDDETGKRAREAMERLGILQRADDPVASLSHGEQRQVEIAMALVTQPRMLLLDEPAAGLSGEERSRLRTILDDLPRSLPVVLIEHDLELALAWADRVLCLNNGASVALGAPADVRNNEMVQAVYLGRVVDA